LYTAQGSLRSALQYYSPLRRLYTRRELLADRIVNFSGVGLSWIGAPVIAIASWQAGDPLSKQSGFWVHGAGLMIMLTCSAMYHFLAWRWDYQQQLLSLDYLGISAMIIGCYVPGMLQIGAFRTISFVCALGAMGVLMEAWRLSQPPSKKNWCPISILHVARFLLMGWSCLVVFPAMFKLLPAGLMGMYGTGGLLYTVGVYFLVSANLEYHMAIWHAVVILASMCFYMANILYLPGLPQA